MEKRLYSNLHHKTHYSCGLAVGTSKDAIASAKEKGLHSIAMTDYCSISGVLDFLAAGKEEKFPVIIGAELNYVDEFDNLFSIVLLIKDQSGYFNLCRLITYAHKNAARYKVPACRLSDLKDFSKGLVCLTGGALGPWSKYWIDEDLIGSPQAKIRELQQIFGEDLYLEFCQSNQCYQWDDKSRDYLQKYEENPHKKANRELLKFADKTRIKVVITSDSYIPNEEDKILQDVIIRTSERGKRGFYIRENRPILRAEELEARIAVEHTGISHNRINTYFENTIEVANKCTSPKITLKDQVVIYPITSHELHEDGMNNTDLLWKIIRTNGRINEDSQEEMDRLNYEIKTIRENGRVDLLDYFLVVEDLVRACTNNGVIVGPGRGSGAGSLLCYALRITHLSPLKYGLLFERFISEGRIVKGSLPDLDLDFSDQKWAMNYLGEKYGWDRVMPIGTFGTMRTKMAIKDAFKLYYPQVEFKTVNKITSKFGRKDEGEEEKDYFDRSLEEDESIKHDLFKVYPLAGNCIRRLIGFNRQTGIHACGIAITQDPLEGIAPSRTNKGKLSLDYNGGSCEVAGIIKYDILSLITLRYIATAVQLIKERHGVKIDIYDIPTDDPLVWSKFDEGDTAKVFQFGSSIAKGILTKITSTCLEDGSMVTSVGRPGPMGNDQHLEFIDRKNGEIEPTPPHPALEEVLKPTLGIMIYQESVMIASQILGGFSLAEADDIRKAMGKKKKKVLRPYRDRFIKYAVENFDDIDEERATHIWGLMETFSGYGFNKSHSICYTYIAYLCMWIKVYYNLEWWFSCLTHDIDDNDKFSEDFQEAQNIIILPDINHSTDNIFIRDNKIQLPFMSIKGIGERANKEIELGKPYSSLKDFYERVNKRVVNKGVFEKLIFAECFQSWGTSLEILREYYEDLRGEAIPEKYLHLNKEQKINLRSKSLSFISLDYYSIYREVFDDPDFLRTLDELKNCGTGEQVIVGGAITSIKKIKTKRKKEDMAKVIITNGRHQADITLFPTEYKAYKSKIVEENVIKVLGKIDFFNNQPQVIATHIFSLEEGIRQAERRRQV